ncbi:hypothetical protein BDV93DRAFT_458159, partial [Ceratobasidium sp. AG-I]
VLEDIVSVLSIAHNAQELLSAEKTPTLALAFPVYETVIEAWQQLRLSIPELSFAIGSGIDKLQEYVGRTRQVPVHSLAMAVNLSLKFEWIDQHWSAEEGSWAREVVKEKVSLKHKHYQF